MDFPRVVITGLGPISAAGTGVPAFWETLQKEDVEVDVLAAAVGAEHTWGSYPFYRPKPWTVHPEDKELPEDAELTLCISALRLAAADASIPTERLGKAALVMTYEAPGIDRLLTGIFQDLLEKNLTPPEEPQDRPSVTEFLDATYQRHRDAVYHTHSFMHLHLAARALEIHGPTIFLNNACASGLYALESAADQLRMGRTDVALVAAAELAQFPTKQLWFNEARVHSTTGVLRPFDRNRDGLILGGGGAALVLETLDAARARGAKIYAEYLGGATSQEGWKVTVPNLTEDYYGDTLKKTLELAGVKAEEIDLLNPHGAGTALGDLAEARGITSVFGNWPDRPRITAFKPYFGHTLGASALLETVAILLSLEHGVIPATPGFRDSDPNLKMECLRSPERGKFTTALKMSSGFAGFTAGAVFKAL